VSGNLRRIVSQKFPYLESEGLLATAEKFSDEAYDFLANLEIISKAIDHAKNLKEMQLDLNALFIRRNTPSVL
jgi:hypothetical protein